MINGGFQNFLHATLGLPGGFGVTVIPPIDTHDGWKGPIRGSRRRKKNDELRKRLEAELYGIVQGIDLSTLDDDEFFELFLLFSD